MNSTKQQNKFSRFMRTHAALLIIIFCVLAITAVVLAVTLTRTPNTIIPDDPVVSDPDDDTNANKPTPPAEKKKVYFRKPVEFSSIDLEFTDGIDENLFVFNPTLGYWATHDGVDLVASEGAQVVSMYDGQVVDAGESVEYGYYVTIDHGDNVVATYASLSDVKVVKGQQVKQGEALGVISTSAGYECENGAHLHLEVYKNKTIVNPMPYVNGEIFREVNAD